MTHTLGADWQDCVDICVIGASKPLFYSTRQSFFSVAHNFESYAKVPVCEPETMTDLSWYNKKAMTKVF